MRVRASFVAAVCLLSAACQKSTLPAVKPNGLALQLSAATISADDGSVTVTAQVFQDGVALLDQSIAFSVTGANTAAGGTVATSTTSGMASYTFTGLSIAGANEVVIATGTGASQITQRAPLTVLPGQITALTLANGTNPPAIAGITTHTDFTLSGVDAHGNAIANPAAFVTTDAPTGAADGLVIRGVTTAGTWNVYAYGGSATTSAPFTIFHADPAITLASLAANQVEAGTTVQIACAQTDAFGNDTATAFAAGDVTTTDAGATVGAPSGNVFTISNLIDKGAFSAKCSHQTIDSPGRIFTVVDTTGPVATAAFTAASAPQGLTADSAYAPGENVTVHVSATDIVGIAKTTVSVIGAGSVNGSPSYDLLEPASTRTSSRDVTFTVSPLARTFDTVTIVAQVSDTTGNTSAPQTFTIHVDPSARLDTPAGVLARTWFEPRGSGTDAVAITTSGGILYVKRSHPGGSSNDDVIRIATTGTAFTVVASDFVPGADQAGSGFVTTSTPFDGLRLFHTEADAGGISSVFAVGTAGTFAPATFTATDLAFGNVGGTDALFTIGSDDFFSTSTIYRIDADRSVTPFCTAAGNGIDFGLVYDGSNGLFVSDSTGEIDHVDSAGNRTVVGSLPGGGLDLVVASGKLVSAGGLTNKVVRGTLAGAPLGAIATNFDAPVALAVGPAGELYVLERGDAGGIPRIVKVTGY